MNLLSVRSAFPKNHYTQADCLESMRTADFWQTLTPASHKLIGKVLSENSGIDQRHFCLDELSHAWQYDTQGLNQYYESSAPRLTTDAIRKALDEASLQPEDIDALLISTCTGYLCPGVSSYVAEQLGLTPNTYLQDMTGLGCGAAIPLIQAARGLIAHNPDAVVVTASVEVCSAAFYIENDAGVLISACIFGDGAAAAIWSGKGGEWQADHFHTLHMPQEREKIRFTNANGKLRNQLHKSVPELAAKAVGQLYQKRSSDPCEWITHGGGRDVIEQLEQVLPTDRLTYTRSTMQNYGNLSSPSVLVALEQFLKTNNTSAKNLWLCSFGAGFSAHSCELTRTA